MENQPLHQEFSRFAGELAESFSFNRSIGQIYGLLYMSPEPLSLDEIARRLAMSKGNASINVRVLESWGAVKSVWVSGSRRDHYEANTDLKGLLMRRVEEGLSRRLEAAESRLETLSGALAQADPATKKKVQELRGMVQKSRKALKVLPKLVKFL